MSKIQELLSGRNEKIDYDKLITDYPWIVENGHSCVLSPDSDGLLCGLLMSDFLDWKIKGFYDGKIMLLENGTSAKDCIYLDMEIFRKYIRSFGHHMVRFNKRECPVNWDNFRNCIQPNNLRNYDGLHDFRVKYPLGTIHMLLGILGHRFKISVPETATAPLLFTDGTFNVLFKYPENVLNWLAYLRADEPESPLKTVFMNEKCTVHALMQEMDKFFRERDNLSVHNERGDRMRISLKDGSPFNIELEDKTANLSKEAVERIIKFIQLLSKYTGWNFKESAWTWEGFSLYKFTKRDFSRDGLSVNGKNFKGLMEKEPLSWAMTSGQNIEYTLENPSKLP
ncbi:MAG: hypothetical protein JW727_01550 [Candidatus Aenigmarchaeota archaeon]|nr:hypothetical protein [Candidatus Aenigmarchaeota archaeon]